MDDTAAQFFGAARAAIPTVLGLQLVEFTLGHYLVLSELDSPLLPGAKRDIEPIDLIKAVFVCSGEAMKRRWQMDSKWLKPWFWWWFRRCNKMNPEPELEAMEQYISDSFQGPVCSRRFGDQEMPIVAPHAYRLIAMAIEVFHQPEPVALSMPLYRLLAYNAASMDLKGKLELNVWTQRHEDLWQCAVKHGWLAQNKENN